MGVSGRLMRCVTGPTEMRFAFRGICNSSYHFHRFIDSELINFVGTLMSWPLF